MHRRNTSGKTGRREIVALAITFLLMAISYPQTTTGRDNDRKNPVRFAGIAPGTAISSAGKIVANPEVTITTAGCAVTGFTFSVLPKGDYVYGPFKTEGNRLRQEQIDWLKTNKGTSMKIFLEDIRLKCSDKTVMETPVVYDVKP